MIDYEGSWDQHIPLVEFMTKTISNRVLEWRLTRLYMEENVEHRCVRRNELKESDWPRLDTRD